jgi:hypothetical protein
LQLVAQIIEHPVVPAHFPLAQTLCSITPAQN